MSWGRSVEWGFQSQMELVPFREHQYPTAETHSDHLYLGHWPFFHNPVCDQRWMWKSTIESKYYTTCTEFGHMFLEFSPLLWVKWLNEAIQPSLFRFISPKTIHSCFKTKHFFHPWGQIMDGWVPQYAKSHKLCYCSKWCFVAVAEDLENRLH